MRISDLSLSAIIAALILILISQPVSCEELEIEEIDNLQKAGIEATQAGKALIIYISRENCPYCRRLEKDILVPLLRSGDYDNKVALKELSWQTAQVIDFSGNKTMADQVIESYGVQGTPTLLFLDAQGFELSKRLEGYQSRDFYWHYLDQAIEEVLSELSQDNQTQGDL